jgi:ketosteroid isomerase-like protein
VDAESKVAAIEEMFREFARRDDARTFEILDEELVFDTRAYPGPETLRTVYHGHEGVRAYWRQWLDAWESVDVVDGPHHEVDDGAVVSWWRQRNRGKSSGAEVEMETAVLWTFQGDRIVRIAAFASRADARAAAGLPE